MAKSKIKEKGAGFVIEGELDFQNKVINVEEIGEYPIDKILEKYDGKIIKINIDETDTEIVSIPEE